MPDMDGFKLLEQIRLEMDIPVIGMIIRICCIYLREIVFINYNFDISCTTAVMSADYEKSVVMKGINHGACDYLIKPIPLEMVKTIWQHVVRAKMKQMKELENFGSIDDGFSQDEDQAPFAADVSLCSENESSWRSSTKKRNEDGVEVEERDDSSTGKRRRVVWSAELHQKFVSVVNQLGVPSKMIIFYFCFSFVIFTLFFIFQTSDCRGCAQENFATHGYSWNH